ncbi:MAG: PEGA domain-containing protein [Deltaproteobacteria bacterium]|nr:PEGA domain-containing protein [Deltaproteobacteria bacterium]
MIEGHGQDPKRWRDGGAPEGALALLATLEEPPPLPPLVRKRVGRVVRAATGSRPAVPWIPILLAAAVALLGFMAGWLWSGEHANETPAVAAPPESIEPEPVAPTVLPASSMEVEPEARDEEPAERRERRRSSMRSTHPDLLDPFEGRRERVERRRRSQMAPNAGELRDPFANRPTMQPTMEAPPLDPFAGRSAETAEHGSLVINTIPWARVFLDGEDTGQNTPVRNLRVSPGRHRIGLRTQDGTMHTVTVTVHAGETMRLMRRL